MSRRTVTFNTPEPQRHRVSVLTKAGYHLRSRPMVNAKATVLAFLEATGPDAAQYLQLQDDNHQLIVVHRNRIDHVGFQPVPRKGDHP
jgi:hypothetical protein